MAPQANDRACVRQNAQPKKADGGSPQLIRVGATAPVQSKQGVSCLPVPKRHGGYGFALAQAAGFGQGDVSASRVAVQRPARGCARW